MRKKKLLLGFSVLLVLGLVYLYYNPGYLFAFRATQGLALRLEGEQTAIFYFKDDNLSKDTLYMRGVIYAQTHEDIKTVLGTNPQITTLVMEDVPGSVDDDINLLASREIRKQGINTYVPIDGMVASGGTDMFLAGKLRSAHPSAQFGVHSWGDDNFGTALEVPKDDPVHQLYLEYYKEMQVPAPFYWYTLEAAPADSIHWMTAAEKHHYNLLNPSMDLEGLLQVQAVLASDAFEGRATEHNEKAQKLIRDYFSGIGLIPFAEDFNDPFTFIDEKSKKLKQGNNLLGYVKGSEYPNEYIVIGAHYDHVGIINDTIYNGADDNASGTSALLALARYYTKKQPRHSIIFAAFDAEELGLWGSRHFVDNPPVAIDQVKLNFNFDMISRNPHSEIYVVGTHQFPQFKPLVASVAEHIPDLKVSFGHDDPDDETNDYWMHSSDNGPFFEKGIATLTFSEEDHPGYHKPTDDVEFTHPDFYKNVVLLIQETLAQIDRNKL